MLFRRHVLAFFHQELFQLFQEIVLLFPKSLIYLFNFIFLFSGGHILSGACIEPIALEELFPDWKERGVSSGVVAQMDNSTAVESP